MSDDPQDVPLELVLEAAGQSLLSGVNTAQPGVVTEYDSTTQMASVRPLVKKAHVQEDDSEKVEDQPEIHDAIVMHMGPGRGRITFPIAVGDVCLIIHTSVSIAKWRLRGGAVDPADDRQHHIADAIALVGLHSGNVAPTSAPTDAVVVHCGAGVKAKIGGPTGTQPTLMGTTYRSAEDTLVTALNTFILAQAAYNAAVGTALGLSSAAATVAAAATTFEAAISAFEAGAAGYLTQTAEVK